MKFLLKKMRDISGQKFGRLLALWPVYHKRRIYSWACQCDCGRIKIASLNDLSKGHTRSCGCLKADLRPNWRDKYPIEYVAFYAAKSRCEGVNNTQFKDYGGRGIKFCFNSFPEFLAEIGQRPSPEYTVDRIDNDGNYEKGNIRWATRKEQIANQRNLTWAKARIAELERRLVGYEKQLSS